MWVRLKFSLTILVHHARLNRARSKIVGPLNLPGENALIGFSDPVESKSAISLVYWV
jgi:hypothetical protein